MLNFCIQEALRLKTASLAKLHRNLYPKLKAEWDYCSMYYAAAYRTASSIIKSWRKRKRQKPVAEKLFVKLHKSLYKLEGDKLSLSVKPGERISIKLLVGEYQSNFLRAYERGELKLGEATLNERYVTIPFIKEVELIEPRGVVALDLNEDCVVAVDERGGVVNLDLRPARTIHTEYFKKRRRIQQKVKSEAVKATLLAKYGQRERRRVEDLLHKAAKTLVQLASGKAILLEDLKGLRKGKASRSRML